MSDLVITKPDGMEDERWQATVKWLNGWLNRDLYGSSPWAWNVCPKHREFMSGDECESCEYEEE